MAATSRIPDTPGGITLVTTPHGWFKLGGELLLIVIMWRIAAWSDVGGTICILILSALWILLLVTHTDPLIAVSNYLTQYNGGGAPATGRPVDTTAAGG